MLSSTLILGAFSLALLGFRAQESRHDHIISLRPVTIESADFVKV